MTKDLQLLLLQSTAIKRYLWNKYKLNIYPQNKMNLCHWYLHGNFVISYEAEGLYIYLYIIDNLLIKRIKRSVVPIHKKRWWSQTSMYLQYFLTYVWQIFLFLNDDLLIKSPTKIKIKISIYFQDPSIASTITMRILL